MRAPSIEDPTEYRQVRVDGLHRWLLSCRDSEQPRLIKQLLPGFASDPVDRAAWLAAAERNRVLDHRGCARVVDCGEHESGPYVASLYRSGAALSSLSSRARAEAPPLSPELVAFIGMELLDALAHVEERDPTLTHLDLDPAGLLVDDDGTVAFLPEFGLWSALPPSKIVRCRFDCGRVQYTSPEVVRSQLADARSDVFSVGVVLFELLAGQRPYAGATQLLVALGIAEGKRCSLHEAAPHAPEPIRDVIEVMLAIDSGQRFQSARAAKAALQSTCGAAPAELRSMLARAVAGTTHFGQQRERHVVQEMTMAPASGRASTEIAWMMAAEAQGGAPAPARGHAPPAPAVCAGERSEGLELSRSPLRDQASAAKWSELTPPPLLLAPRASSLSPPPSDALPSSTDPTHEPRSRDASAAPAELVVNDGRTQFLLNSTPPPMMPAPSMVPAPSKLGRSPRSADLRIESILAVAPRVEMSVARAESDPLRRRKSFRVAEAVNPSPDRAWSPRASNGKWQDPSVTLFEMKSRAGGATVGRRTQMPFAAIVCLSAFFGFTAVTGLYLLLRLWQ